MRTLLPVALLLSISSIAQATPLLEVEALRAGAQDLTNLSCQAEQGIFLAGPAVVASLAGTQTALASCAQGELATITWTWSATQESSVAVVKSSSAAVSACVEAAINVQQAEIIGQCSADLLLGPAIQANASTAR